MCLTFVLLVSICWVLSSILGPTSLLIQLLALPSCWLHSFFAIVTSTLTASTANLPHSLVAHFFDGWLYWSLMSVQERRPILLLSVSLKLCFDILRSPHRVCWWGVGLVWGSASWVWVRSLVTYSTWIYCWLMRSGGLLALHAHESFVCGASGNICQNRDASTNLALSDDCAAELVSVRAWSHTSLQFCQLSFERVSYLLCWRVSWLWRVISQLQILIWFAQQGIGQAWSSILGLLLHSIFVLLACSSKRTVLVLLLLLWIVGRKVLRSLTLVRRACLLLSIIHSIQTSVHLVLSSRRENTHSVVVLEEVRALSERRNQVLVARSSQAIACVGRKHLGDSVVFKIFKILLVEMLVIGDVLLVVSGWLLRNALSHKAYSWLLVG